MDGDLFYFCRRAEEELAAATRAAHPRARLAHLEMAERYHDLASGIACRELELSDEIIRIEPTLGSA